MHSDAYFAIGRTEHVCQDYALASSSHDGTVHAIVSDGCSSSPTTDFGARFLAQAVTKQLARHRGRIGPVPVICAAQSMARQAQLETRSLDATLLCARADEGRIRIVAAGDGVIAARRHDGTIEAWSITYAGEAPAYLSYLLDDRRLATYLRNHGRRSITHFVDGTVVGVDERPIQVEWSNGSPFAIRNYELTFDLVSLDYSVVALMSDGVRSFQRVVQSGTSRRFEPVPLHDVLRELFAFRSLRGEFVIRRCRRFLGPFCREHGWQHNDDFALAAIALEAA